MSRSYRGKSDAQANAEALARRGLPYSAASGVSFSVRWDWHKRDPLDLRDAVRMARRAYSDEVPDKLHDGTLHLAPDGSPRMTANASRTIFGSGTETDTPRPQCHCHVEPDADGHIDHKEDCPKITEAEQRPFIEYYLAPFRATLAGMELGDEASRKRAAIVSAITIGGEGPQEAAIKAGVPRWCAKTVAEDAVRAFLRRLSDVKVNVRTEAVAS